jgi:hypothetical protein
VNLDKLHKKRLEYMRQLGEFTYRAALQSPVVVGMGIQEQDQAHTTSAALLGGMTSPKGVVERMDVSPWHDCSMTEFEDVLPAEDESPMEHSTSSVWSVNIDHDNNKEEEVVEVEKAMLHVPVVVEPVLLPGMEDPSTDTLLQDVKQGVSDQEEATAVMIHPEPSSLIVVQPDPEESGQEDQDVPPPPPPPSPAMSSPSKRRSPLRPQKAAPLTDESRKAWEELHAGSSRTKDDTNVLDTELEPIVSVAPAAAAATASPSSPSKKSHRTHKKKDSHKTPKKKKDKHKAKAVATTTSTTDQPSPVPPKEDVNDPSLSEQSIPVAVDTEANVVSHEVEEVGQPLENVERVDRVDSTLPTSPPLSPETPKPTQSSHRSFKELRAKFDVSPSTPQSKSPLASSIALSNSNSNSNSNGSRGLWTPQKVSSPSVLLGTSPSNAKGQLPPAPLISQDTNSIDEPTSPTKMISPPPVLGTIPPLPTTEETPSTPSAAATSSSSWMSPKSVTMKVVPQQQQDISSSSSPMLKSPKSPMTLYEAVMTSSVHDIDSPLVALVSLFPMSMHEFLPKQSRVLLMFQALDIQPVYVDGSDPKESARRNELFELSGKRGVYPQLFVRKKETGKLEYFADFNKIEALNDCQLLKETLEQACQ